MQTAQIALAEHRQPVLLPRHPLIACRSQPLVRAIIFDMDGVLVESRKAAAKALATVARQEGVKVGCDAIEVALDRGNSAASIVECLLPHLNGMPGELDRVARAYTEASVANIGMIGKSAIAARLPALFGKFGLAIATNRTKDTALEILDHLGMLAFFGAVMTLADAPAKPDPKMVVLAIMAMGESVASSVFVGDKPSDYLAGKAAGVRTIMVDAGKGEMGCAPFLSEFGR
jgi:phosphoglycolate phosphatase-like HAD superfamily hydrolase